MDTDIRQTIGGREIVIERIFNAPRNPVWRAWSERAFSPNLAVPI